MRNTDADTACIFNCQMGKGRTTTGMILAVLLKDILFGDTSIKYYKNDKVTKEEFPDEDEYLEERAKRGQYEVLDNISKYIPGVDEGKAHIDHIIDLCGVPPAGKIIIFKPNWSKTLFPSRCQIYLIARWAIILLHLPLPGYKSFIPQ